MTTLLALALGAAALAFISAPLLRRDEEAPPVREEQHSRASLDARRAMHYEGIRDLDFEHSMGKLDEADYRELRENLVREAAQVLEEMEATGSDDALDRWIEAEVGDRRGRPLPRAATSTAAFRCPACDRALAPDARFCDGCGARAELAACSRCGTVPRVGAAYCSHCGETLKDPGAVKA